MDRDWVDRAAYPFEDRWVDLPAGRIHYVDEGHGPTLLFVHGTPTWSFEWRHLIRGLRDAYRCVAPDLPGFGLSERPAGYAYTPEAHAATVAELVRALALDDLTLVAHDFGGPIGLPLALAEPPRAGRLVLLNTWMWSFADDRSMARKARLAGGLAGRFLYRRANAPLRILMPGAYGDRSALTPAIHDQYLRVFPDPDSRERVLWALARALIGSSDFYDGLWRRRERLAGLPALVVWGTRDPAFPPRFLERWREALPDGRYVELPVGHWPHEEAPESVVAEIRAFLGGAS